MKKDRQKSTKIGGWCQNSVEEIYDNPWIQLTHEEVTTPAGTPGIYGVVHFKNVAVGVLPIDSDGNTWLVRQSRYTLNQYTWEIPEGGAPHGEDPLDAAKRELEEETGLRARNWKKLIDLHLSNSVTDEKGVIFVARDLYEGTQQLEDSEDITLRKIPLMDAINMVFSGEITDALSVVALMYFAGKDYRA